MKQGFETQLAATPEQDGKFWTLTEPLVWRWADGTKEVCPKGMRTDFASVPDLGFMFGIIAGLAHHFEWWPLFWFALLICVLAKRIDDDDKTDAPACFHDQDYALRIEPRYVADWHLFVRMRANRVQLWKCWLYWLNLRLFGWWAWFRVSEFGHHKS